MMVGHGSGTYSSQQQVLVLHSVSITSILCHSLSMLVITGYHHLRGEGGGVFTLHLDDSDVVHVLIVATMALRFT